MISRARKRRKPWPQIAFRVIPRYIHCTPPHVGHEDGVRPLLGHVLVPSLEAEGRSHFSSPPTGGRGRTLPSGPLIARLAPSPRGGGHFHRFALTRIARSTAPFLLALKLSQCVSWRTHA